MNSGPVLPVVEIDWLHHLAAQMVVALVVHRLP